jgi:hypothetical protein
MTRPAKRTDRERFEAYLMRRYPGFGVSRDGNGYMMVWIDGMWIGWQAALRSERRKRA